MIIESMMPEKDGFLMALFDLQTQLQASHSLESVALACDGFASNWKLAEKLTIMPSQLPINQEPNQIEYQIPNTPYKFSLTPFQFQPKDQLDYWKLICSMVAVLPPLTGNGNDLNEAHHHLFTLIGEKLAEQRRFRHILSQISAELSRAFEPGSCQLFSYQSHEQKFALLYAFGELEPRDENQMVELAPAIRKQILDGETAVLRHDHKSELYLPIRYNGHTRGVIRYCEPGSAHISLGTLSALEQLVGYFGIGLSNETLTAQAWQRANQLETIYRVTESARSLRALEPTLVEIHQQVMRAYQASTCFISLLDQKKKQILFPCVWQDGQPKSWPAIPLKDKTSLVRWVIKKNTPFATDNWHEEDQPVHDDTIAEGDFSIMCVPMRVGNEVLGAISVHDKEKDAFDASDFQTLMAISSHSGVIIKNAQLFSDTREQVDISKRDYQTAVSLRQAIADISTSLEYEEVANQLLVALGKVIKYSNAWAFLFVGHKIEYTNGRNYYERPLAITPESYIGIWQDHPWLKKVVQTKSVLNIKNAQGEKKWPDYEAGKTVGSWLAAPLLAGKRLLGILIIESEFQNAFNIQEEWIVSSLAAHAGITIQNAQLFFQTQQQLLELGTLYQASATMNADLDQQAVLQSVTSEMVSALQVDSCTIFVWNEITKTLTPAAHKNKFSDPETELDGQLKVGLGVVNDLHENAIIQNIFASHQLVILRADEECSAEEAALLKASHLKSLLLVPLVRREIVVGLLAMGQIEETDTYSERHLRLAQNLSNQAAVAIEHSRLYGQAQRRIDELSTFHEIVLKLNSPLQLSSVLDTITESALKMIDATNLHIFLYDQKTNEFTKGSALWRDGRRTAAVQKPRATGEGLTASVVKKGLPIVINNAADHPYYQSPEAQAWGIYAIAGFPLKYGDEVLGAFTATYLHPHAFTEDELLLLNLLAEQAAVAVRNAGLYSESQRRLADMSALVDMAKQVTGDLKLNSVLQTTVQILRQLMNARASTITMLSDDGETLILKAAAGVNKEFINARMELDDSISGQVVSRSSMVYIRDTKTEPDFIFFDEIVRSLLAVPLIVRDRVVGTLSIDSDQPNAFQESDIQLLTIAAAQVGIAISNARLFEEVEARASELRVAYEEVKESDRLKDELVQNVSHELRTPLTFVKGYVDLLMDGEMGLLNEEQQSALNIISDKTTDITRIIDDIITLQKINSGNLKLEKTSLSDFLETAVASHKMIADQKGLHINSMMPSQNVMVIIDKGRINQVLDNLIGNAMKFSPNGGTITIGSEVDEKNVTVTVKDEGIGILPEKHKRIFERFYQIDGSASRRFGGTGIGLAIVKRIVDAHNGRIWVESEIQKGSTFFFQLPIASEEESIRETVS